MVARERLVLPRAPIVDDHKNWRRRHDAESSSDSWWSPGSSVGLLMPQAALKGGCVPGEDGPARAGADEDHSWRCSVDACRRDAGSAPPFAMESGSASVGCRRASLKRAARWRSVAVQAVDAAYQRLRRSRTFATRRAGSRRRKGSSSARQKWCFSGDETARRGLRPGPGLRSGDWIWGLRENVTWAGRFRRWVFEPEHFGGRPCDWPGCAASAYPSVSLAHSFSRHVVVSDEGSEGESDRAGRAPRFL